jgi:hypothetical protein
MFSIIEANGQLSEAAVNYGRDEKLVNVCRAHSHGLMQTKSTPLLFGSDGAG